MQEERSKVKIHEVQEGSVVVEIFEKDMQGERIYYDIKLCREFRDWNSEEVKRSPMLQQRDMDDALRAILMAKGYIGDKIRHNRRMEREESNYAG